MTIVNETVVNTHKEEKTMTQTQNKNYNPDEDINIDDEELYEEGDFQDVPGATEEIQVSNERAEAIASVWQKLKWALIGGAVAITAETAGILIWNKLSGGKVDPTETVIPEVVQKTVEAIPEVVAG